MIKLRSWTQADLAASGGKTLRQIQNFFNKAKWSYKQLEAFRLRFIQNKPDYRDRKSDFVALDGSTTTKNKDAHFGDLVSNVWSGRDKRSVNGIKFFGGSVQTKNGTKYILDFSLYFKQRWMSEFQAWEAFSTRVAKKSKGWLFVLDRGFRNKYFIYHLFKVLKRMFLIRLSVSQHVLVKNDEVSPSRKQRRKRKKKNYFFLSISSTTIRILSCTISIKRALA